MVSCGIFTSECYYLEFFLPSQASPKGHSNGLVQQLDYCPYTCGLSLLCYYDSTSFSHHVAKTHEAHTEMGLEGLVTNKHKMKTIKLPSAFILTIKMAHLSLGRG